MTDKKISELPAGTTFSNADKIPLVQGSTTVYGTTQQLKAFVQSGLTITASQIATSSGTASSSTYLRGDNVWAPIAGGNGSGSVVTGNAATFDTMADLNVAAVDAAINYVQTTGYWAIGDSGAAAYRRKLTGEPDFELDRTSNGGAVKWELVPRHNIIPFKAAGARAPTDYNIQDHDCYPAHRAIDKFIKAKGYNGFTVLFDSGLYYSSTAFHFKRVGYKMIGCAGGTPAGNSTNLRFHETQCGMISNYQWGAGPDYMMALGGWTLTLIPNTPGPAVYVWKGAGTSAVPEGSVFRVVQGGVTGAGGPADIPGITPGVDLTWGTCKLRYEGNLVTDPVPGGGTKDYDIGADTNSSAGDMVWENLMLWGYFDPRDTTPSRQIWRKNTAGIVMRIRGRISNCFSLGWAGSGFAIVADGDTDFGGPGNANGWYVSHSAAYYNGKDGFHVGYSNANAGAGYQLDVSQNGRWGYADWAFLTNLWSSVQCAYDGRRAFVAQEHHGFCQYNGYVWQARIPLLGSEGWPNYKNETPGVATNAWNRFYKTYDDITNSEMTITAVSGSPTLTTVTLGSATSGNVSMATAGAVDGGVYFIKITEGAKFAIAPCAYIGSPASFQIKQPDRPGAVYGVAASSDFQSNGMPALPTFTTAATARLLAAGVADIENAAWWDPSMTFEPCGAFSTNNQNNRCLILDPYFEGGTIAAQWQGPTTVIGGIMSQAYSGGFVFTENTFPYIYASARINNPPDGGDHRFSVTLNTGFNGGEATAFGWSDVNGAPYALHQHKTGVGGSGYSGGDMILDYTGAGYDQYPPPLVIRSGGESNYGRSTGADFSIQTPPIQITNFVMGDGFARGGRLMRTGGAAPTTGAHAFGEKIFNDGTGGDTTTIYWHCSAAGSPGTWVART